MKKDERAEKLAHAIGLIDEDLVAQAEDDNMQIYARRPAYLRILAAAACLLLALAVIVPVVSLGGREEIPVMEDVGIRTPPSVSSYTSYEDIYNALYGVFASNAESANDVAMTYGIETMTSDDLMADSASPGLGAPAMSENKGYAYTSEGMRGEADYSDTNVQVENVDEGDIIKTDGEYIYRLFGGDEIAIIRADDLALMSKIEVERDDYTDYKNSTEMYVEGDRLVVISGYNVYFDGSEQIAPQDYYERMERFW
ncbi:MAG: beta-propeller domain-containing protein, partial [Clostridia bacterium]|nr:beta-propeller domain-containing protein [Clostridia bacterium]